MESEAVRRRMNMLAAHFASIDDTPPTHLLLPMNCSSSLNSVISRRDNRMYFGRQSSASQGFFMRQAPTTEQSQAGGVPFKCSAPLFSRATARIEENLSDTEPIQSPGPKDWKSAVLDSEFPPCFSRPTTCIGRKQQSHSKKHTYSAQSNGNEWSPRMDVAESGRSYILTLEIPGVNAKDIRVEVNDRSLTIMGKRNTLCWKTSGCSNDSISAYLKREILQGPYQVDWPFPSDANRDTVSAEFLDGILQVIIPKL